MAKESSLLGLWMPNKNISQPVHWAAEGVVSSVLCDNKLNYFDILCRRMETIKLKIPN